MSPSAQGTPTPYNFGPLNYYQRPNQRYTAGTFLNFQMNENAEVYGEFMFLKDESNSQIAPSGIFLQKYTVSCANPLWGAAEFAAFCGDFGLTTADDTQIEFRRRNIEGGGRAQELNHQAYRGGIGIKGALTRGMELTTRRCSREPRASAIRTTMTSRFRAPAGRSTSSPTRTPANRPAVRRSSEPIRCAFRTTSTRPAPSIRRSSTTCRSR